MDDLNVTVTHTHQICATLSFKWFDFHSSRFLAEDHDSNPRENAVRAIGDDASSPDGEEIVPGAGGVTTAEARVAGRSPSSADVLAGKPAAKRTIRSPLVQCLFFLLLEVEGGRGP